MVTHFLHISKCRLAAGALAAILAVSASAATTDGDRLVNAEADQDTALVRALIQQHADVNATRADGATALLLAAHWNDLETANLLLGAGAKVNAADAHGVTPLAEAAVNASLPMVNRLLEAGANPNLAQHSGLTPLMTAAHTGNAEIIKALLQHGANVNAATEESGITALMWAIADGNRAAAKLLVDAKANVRATSAKGVTPLLYAAATGNVEMAKMLFAAGVKPNETGADKTSPLALSIAKGYTEFPLFLLEQGADANGMIDGVPALQTAAGNAGMWLADWMRQHEGLNNPSGVRPNRVQLVKALLAHGANVNGRINHSAMFMSYVGYPKKGAFETYACGTGDLRGATALWVASNTAHTTAGTPGSSKALESSEVIRTLLAAGADQRLTTDDGTTPLMAAAGLGMASYSGKDMAGLPRGPRSIGAEEAVRILVEAGADINATNEADFTALHGAAFRGDDEVIEYLVSKGANIDARDYRGRTPYRLAESSHQSFELQAWPETAEVLKRLGANTQLGLPGTLQERLQDIIAEPVAASQSNKK